MKKLKLNLLLVRNLEAVDLFENLLVSAVTSIILIRLFLHLTGFPQLGNEDLHIAHMLWGGLFMLSAILILLFFSNKSAGYIASIIGGIGFGTFIDELGKFLTRDNNYFFQPTIALIYIIFLIIYLLVKFIVLRTTVTDKEYLFNSLDYIEEAILNDLDAGEKKRALSYLRKVKNRSALYSAIKNLILELDTISVPEQGLFIKIKNYFSRIYGQILGKVWFENLIILVFILQPFLSIFILYGRIYATLTNFFQFQFAPYSFLTWSYLISLLFSILLVLNAVRLLPFNRLKSYLNFKRSLYVSIFLSQFLAFYLVEFYALWLLALNLILLTWINYFIYQEKNLLESAKQDSENNRN